ncbi:MAG: hypothetical protein B6D72_13995 [gamma proteobacterium symbiont of Ctena orbiculata]|uniref:Uncharacterized protein n=1 Tax=Candidatus Thiodiazotropha taylori TaxID=2792791 RepID=A0A944M7N6_9GAMM|nr:hypothetical protein [Candidatus Thiodiazotropha taylori]PUB89579.1 MAG: hypothetical protein DBP00_02115 [gamma proteobacterium symbiont of Ctena orbiculata]MBT2989486.1 hypothetical protein [Candidatus Thiodiazotropha taylori]MBT2997066.1 hypothetical protein [Candidatus Thiodiazotropha taylori]MBT3001220.1 hypothetical protein [Candidatus Thiodiazotropha taylori]
MQIKKIVRLLGNYLDRGKKRGKEDLDTIDDLLKRLEGRRDQLRHKLLQEKRVCKQKRLKAELKIVEMKLKKGRKRRQTFK